METDRDEANLFRLEGEILAGNVDFLFGLSEKFRWWWRQRSEKSLRFRQFLDLMFHRSQAVKIMLVVGLQFTGDSSDLMFRFNSSLNGGEAITNPAIPGSDVPLITDSKDYVGGWASIHWRFIGSDVPIQLIIKWRRNLQLCWKPKHEHTRNHPAAGVGSDSLAVEFWW